MQTQPTIEPTGSPVPGVIPEPVHVHHDTVAAHERLAATPTTSGTSKPASSPGRRNPARIVLARLLSTIRGDKYMVDAYPPAGHRAVAARARDDVTQPGHAGDVAADVRVGVASEPDTTAVASRITTLEARVEHLEATLEAFQDAVYRQSVLEGRRIAELSKRTAPHEMARALSQDARRHGV